MKQKRILLILFYLCSLIMNGSGTHAQQGFNTNHDLHDLEVKTIRLPENVFPRAVQPLSDNLVCLTFLGSPTLAFFDTSRVRFSARLTLPREARLLVTDPDRKKLVVVTDSKPTLIVINVDSHKIELTAILPSGITPAGVVLDERHHVAYIGDGSQPVLYVMDTKTGIVTNHLRLSGYVEKMAFDQESQSLYVATTKAGSEDNASPSSAVDVIDLVGLRLSSSIALPQAGAQGLVVAESGKSLIVLSSDQAMLMRVALGGRGQKPVVSIIKRVSEDWQADYPMGRDLAYDQGSDNLYVECEDANTTWLCLLSGLTLTLKSKINISGSALVLGQSLPLRASKLYFIAKHQLVVVKPG